MWQPVLGLLDRIGGFYRHGHGAKAKVYHDIATVCQRLDEADHNAPSHIVFPLGPVVGRLIEVHTHGVLADKRNNQDLTMG